MGLRWCLALSGTRPQDVPTRLPSLMNRKAGQGSEAGGGLSSPPSPAWDPQLLPEMCPLPCSAPGVLTSNCPPHPRSLAPSPPSVPGPWVLQLPPASCRHSNSPERTPPRALGLWQPSVMGVGKIPGRALGGQGSPPGRHCHPDGRYLQMLLSTYYHRSDGCGNRAGHGLSLVEGQGKLRRGGVSAEGEGRSRS